MNIIYSYWCIIRLFIDIFSAHDDFLWNKTRYSSGVFFGVMNIVEKDAMLRIVLNQYCYLMYIIVTLLIRFICFRPSFLGFPWWQSKRIVPMVTYGVPSSQKILCFLISVGLIDLHWNKDIFLKKVAIYGSFLMLLVPHTIRKAHWWKIFMRAW